MNKKLERAYYDILEIKKDADSKEIKRAFKKAALQALLTFLHWERSNLEKIPAQLDLRLEESYTSIK